MTRPHHTLIDQLHPGAMLIVTKQELRGSPRSAVA